MGTQTKEKYLHIRIDSETKEKLLKYCNDKLITPSKLIRKLLIDYIENEKTK